MSSKRPKTTSTGTWIDAEDPLGVTVVGCCAVLEQALHLQAGDLDPGQRLMIETIVTTLDALDHELNAELEEEDEEED